MPQNRQTVRTATRNSQRVMKELTAEELSLITNVQSLLNEITSMGPGQGQVAAGPAGTAGTVTMEEEEEEEAGSYAPETGTGGTKPTGPIFQPGHPNPSRVEGEEEEEEEEDALPGDGGQMQVAPANAAPQAASRAVKGKGKARKAIIVGEPDASTGSSDAEERLEDLPEWDEENIDEVAKAIIRMALGHGVKKSRPSNPLVLALAQVGRAIKEMADTQRLQGNVINDMLEGLGVAKGLEQAQPRTPRNRPVQTMPQDNANVIKEFINALTSVQKGGGGNGSVGTEPASQAERVRKGMGELALALGQLAGPLWNPPMPGSAE